MTLIIMLILAGISLSGLIGGKGLFKRTEDASNTYNEKKAREVLETVLLTDGQFEKNINPEYNEEEFLNKLIKEEIPGSDVRGDVAIVGEYAYELDRSVPKIGIRGNNGYLGNPKDLVWPDIDATVKLADDKKDATIKIEASEKKNGVNKIEIWLLGEKIKEYTYDPSKPEVTENYIATQNGKYTIKAYGELMDSKTVEVTGIVASVKFEPNGDNTWKKSHSTTVTIQETADKVVNSKYYWSNSVTTPDDSKFPENQTFKSGDTITKNNDTGTYYLWTRLQTQSGEILKWRSNGFNFDNQGPNITALSYTAVNYSSFKLNVTAIDAQSGIVKYEFFVGGSSKGKITANEVKTSNSQSFTVTGAAYGNNSCYVIVTDKLGHTTRKDITAKTLMDTTGPNITSFTATKSSETAIALSATANDTGTGVVKFVFYVDNVIKSTQTCSATTSSVTKSITVSGLSTGSHSCKVIVYDAKNNSSTKTTSGTTKLYTWTRWNYNSSTSYTLVKDEYKNVSLATEIQAGAWASYSFNSTTGKFTLSSGKGMDLYRYGSDLVGKYLATQSVPMYTTTGAASTKYNLSGIYHVSSLVSPTSGYASSRTYKLSYWHSKSETKYSKGTTQYSDVTSTSKSTYPNGGVSGSYWYVYKGVY